MRKIVAELIEQLGPVTFLVVLALWSGFALCLMYQALEGLLDLAADADEAVIERRMRREAGEALAELVAASIVTRGGERGEHGEGVEVGG